jgi:hypothetical protein
VVLGDFSQCGEFADAGIGEQDVDTACLVLYQVINPVKVGEVRRVGADGYGVRADFRRCSIEFRLTAAGNEDVGAFRRERLAVANPMPLLPPVTTATLASSFPLIRGLQW